MARKILLADDSVTAQNMGRKILTDAGYEVITVNNGSAALKKISEARPDLIVLDVYMPGYSGLEVCQRLKEAQETSRIPVLLTVGKLEPFKPEEARRVRADSFIVKPFEASELLSALTKLEDKVVPRAENSKPGRFARSIAAIEEGRYDKTVAGDEDSGWKNRIAFPSAKKEKPAEAEDGDDPAIYNAVNKDLRTVVDHSPARSSAEANAAEAHVDLGALAPPGLPTDVTPEEIAALAAAAAQVKSTVAGATEPDAAEPKEASHVVAEVSQPAQSSEPERIDSKPVEAKADAELKTEAVSDVPATRSIHEFSRRSDEPVTMAAAAGAEGGSFISRWTAVAVALGPEEADLSLEAEMQKAFAALATAPQVEPEPTAAVGIASVAAATPQESGMSEPPTELAQAATHEIVQALSEIAGVAMDSVSPAAEGLLNSEPHSVQESGRDTAGKEQVAAARDEAIVAAKESETQPAVPESKAEEGPMGSAEHDMSPTEVGEQAAVRAIEETSSSETAPNASSAPAEISANLIETTQNSAYMPAEPVHPAASEVAEKESDIAETTAAAWASWRKIRESGDVHTPPPSAHSGEPVPPSSPDDSAAMAVAAGAEHHRKEASVEPEQESAEIASIVDSVLADLRPKIVEEISRKLGKKK